MATVTKEYNLVSQNNLNSKKSLYYIRFTDSANRALNEYINNKGKFNKTPCIKLQRNDGKLFIPSASKSNYTAEFTFDITSNAVIEGQQGRLECIAHKSPSQKKMYKLGSLSKRIRVHANEDVYETTKIRMAAIEQQQKKNCPLQIEWNDTCCLGKRADNDTKVAKYARLSQNASIKNNNANQTGKINNGNNVMDNAKRKLIANPLSLKSSQLIIKRPLRERLIHMLAIKPYKKPEIYAAIHRDGIRDSDKAHIMTTLMSIASLRDNTYHILRHVWNDVQEDWPFYTEQERQLMKRNKPQNLTPPGSDSGISVGSNHSPNSIVTEDVIVGNNSQSYSQFNSLPMLHNDAALNQINSQKSPNNNSNNNMSMSMSMNASNVISGTLKQNRTGSPKQSNLPSCPHSASNKRPGYFNGVDGFQTKRQRISHYQRPEARRNADTEETVLSHSISNSNSIDEVIEKCATGSNFSSISRIPTKPKKAENIRRTGNTGAGDKLNPPIAPVSSGGGTSMLSPINNRKNETETPQSLLKRDFDFTPDVTKVKNPSSSSVINQKVIPRAHGNANAINQGKSLTSVTTSKGSPNTSSSSFSPSTFRPPNIQPTISVQGTSSSSSAIANQKHPAVRYEKPKYMRDYVTITSLEQRRNYKEDFNVNYKEYQVLHDKVESVSRSFSELGASLKQHKKGTAEHARIEQEIIKKYKTIHSTEHFQSAKRRFEYLHDKLSHIKGLVYDYDENILKNQMNV